MSTRKEAVIVGAGAGGLRAAGMLAASGVDVVVLEARDRIGGRLLSMSVDDGQVDLGATWFWDTEPRIVSLINEAGFAPFPQHSAGDMVFQQSRDSVQRLDGNQLDSPSGRLPLGMASVTEHLAATLDLGTIELGTEVRSIVLDEENRVTVATEEATWSARHVILAVPPSLAMARIDFGGQLEDRVGHLARATPVWMGSMVKAVAVFERPFWREQGLAGAAFSYTGPMREIHDMSGRAGTPAALFGFCALEPGTPAPTEAQVVAQLVELFGSSAATPTSVFIVDWRAEEFTSPPNVEQLTNYQTYGHPVFARPAMMGRLHWASTETSPVAPGHIEGALAAADRAAEAVLSALRKPRSTNEES